VTGYEREKALLEEARRLQPGIEWETDSRELASLPAADGAFDFAMCFTVLQHVHDGAAERVARELRRIAAADSCS
jgi:2-polyprenyl-3-methyl-5-hydroxy-6-metoxy-1,4-benzoquinol methylase